MCEAEHAAMQRCVRAAIAAPQRASSVKINVGWCENDFQIDISTAAGRTEYKRIIDRAASLGIESILFAPRNSESREHRQRTECVSERLSCR